MSLIFLHFRMALSLYTKISIFRRLGVRLIMTTPGRAEKAMEELKVNPYYDKYAEKLAKIQQTSPAEFVQKLADQTVKKQKKSDKKVPEEPNRQFTELLKPKEAISKITDPNEKTLDSVMKLELIQDKSASEIEEIWRKYHTQKPDTISACIKSNVHENMQEIAKKYPTFLLTLPRSQGYEFVMCQHKGNTVHFTPLICYQVHKENAPECLAIHHFLDLSQSKGIVLMKGEYDKTVINAKEALCLINQLQLFYNPANTEKVELLKKFTDKPLEFKHTEIIEQIEKLSL